MVIKLLKLHSDNQEQLVNIETDRQKDRWKDRCIWTDRQINKQGTLKVITQKTFTIMMKLICDDHYDNDFNVQYCFALNWNQIIRIVHTCTPVWQSLF